VSKAAGAFTIIISAWLFGRSLTASARRNLRRAEELLRRVEELHYEVTKLETPLPELLLRLEREGKPGDASFPLPGEGGNIASRWLALAETLAPGEEELRLFAELGLTLSHSQEPERCFVSCERGLRKCAEQREQRYAECKRLTTPLSTCAGILLALLLW